MTPHRASTRHPGPRSKDLANFASYFNLPNQPAPRAPGAKQAGNRRTSQAWEAETWFSCGIAGVFRLSAASVAASWCGSVSTVPTKTPPESKNRPGVPSVQWIPSFTTSLSRVFGRLRFPGRWSPAPSIPQRVGLLSRASTRSSWSLDVAGILRSYESSNQNAMGDSLEWISTQTSCFPQQCDH